MYYLEMIQRFWSFNESRSIGSTGISMYLYLLKTGYVNDRYDFKISDVVIAKELGLTRKTVKIAKQKLQGLGLIRYEIKNGVPCYYRLVLDYPFQLPDPRTEMIIETEDETTYVSEEGDLVESTPSLTEIRAARNIPTIDEFLNYAATLDSYDPKLAPIIIEKYESWITDDWQNNAGRPITNWKSLLKSIIPYMKFNEDMHLSSIEDIPKIERPDLK